MRTAAIESKTEIKSLCFYTTGESFTNLLRSFLEEGSYKKVYQILEDGGMKKYLIKQFFLFCLRFEGDSRDENGLSVVSCEQAAKDYSAILVTGMRTALNAKRMEEEHLANKNNEPDDDFTTCDGYELHNWFGASKEIENIGYLLKVFTRDHVNQLIWRKAIVDAGYKIR